MAKCESTKRCRKRIEGYSEIVVHVPGSDSLSDIFRTERNCINCKCLILSMIVITICAALSGCFLLIELQKAKATTSLQQVIDTNEPNSTNHTARTNGTSIFNNTLGHTDATEIGIGPLHERKKRNTSNETDIPENNYNSTFQQYYNNFRQKYDDFKSAVEKLHPEMQNYWSIVSKNQTSIRPSGQSLTLEDNSVLRNESSFSATSQVNRSRRDPENQDGTKNEQNFISFIQGTTNASAIANEDHVEANITERISSTPDQANVSTGVTSGTDHTKRRADLTTTEAGTEAMKLDIGTSPTGTKSENHLENDSLNRDVTSSTKITVSLYPDRRNAGGDDDGYASNDVGTASINEIHQNSYSTQQSFDKSRLDQNKLDETKIQYSPSTLPNEFDSKVSDLISSSTTHRNNIMKISPKSTTPQTEMMSTDPSENQLSPSAPPNDLNSLKIRSPQSETTSTGPSENSFSPSAPPNEPDSPKNRSPQTEKTSTDPPEIQLSSSTPPNELNSSKIRSPQSETTSTNPSETQFSPSAPPNEPHLSVSDLNNATTSRSNVMKISPKIPSPQTETTTADQMGLQATTEDFPISPPDESNPDTSEDPSNAESTVSVDKELKVIEIKQKLDVLYTELIEWVNKTESTTYLLKDVPENTSKDVIIKVIAERWNLNQTRKSRDADSADPQWYMLCYQETIKQNGSSDITVVKVALNQSEIEKILIPIHRYGAGDWPPYSAHSLGTHKQYQGGISTNNQTTGDKLKKVYMFPSGDNSTSTENVKDSKYYCTYSQSRDANETEESLESKLKLLLSNDTLLNEIINDLCLDDEKMCSNGKQCIKDVLWCDQIIHCEDRSDEADCSCRDLINEEKLCDGYFDCPNGEDEEECFDCSKNQFSCNDFRKGPDDKVLVTCIPLEERCDGIPQCPNIKDEKDCEILSNKIHHNNTFVMSYLEGYLHRNWKGKWYPVCNDYLQKLAIRACESELGIRNIRGVQTEIMQIISNQYNGGEFITVQENGQYSVIDRCDPENTYTYVRCPSEYCGSRMNLESIDKYKSKREITNKTMSKEEQLHEILTKILSVVRPEFRNRNRRSDDEDPRVVGGETSKPGAWPWIAALNRNGIFHCGAMILDDTWLLSAAHCVERYHEYYYEIQAGILRRFSFSPMQQIRKVAYVIRHEQYDRTTMKNDIALLRVDPPLKLNRWVQATCLPEARPPWGPPTGTYCTAVGWGATREHGSDPDNMMEVQVPILPSCKHRPDIEGHEICAGYMEGLRDTCQGDSGGPLLCKIPAYQDRWYVSGIVSHGEGCARRMEPGVYTRIAIHLGWILDITAHFPESQRDFQIQRPKLKCPGMQCPGEGQCIAQRRVCDKVLDCLQGEDELNSDCQKEWSGSARKSNDIVGMHHFPIHTNRSIGNSAHRKNGSEFHWHHTEQHKPEFVCEIINQTIPEEWYCDDEVDCEDGTDEINCCAGILKKINSSLICNGVPDCHDWSDEKNCSAKNCTQNEFTCYRSHTCVNQTSVCDGKSDCPGGEDEQHCYALTERFNVTLDYFKIPAYKEGGTLMQNTNGTWKPYCTSMTLERSPALNEEMYKICKKLGFKTKNDNQIHQRELLDYPCTLIYLKCLNYENDASILPWLANIYVNGTKQCNGLLLTDQWLVVDYSCPSYNLQKDHVVAVLGQNRVIGDRIQSVHEQIIRVDYVFSHVKRNATLMHFENPANTSEHVKPLRNGEPEPTIISSMANKECFMIANSTDPVVIPIICETDCWGDDYCLYRPTNKTQFCEIYNKNYTLSPLICEALRGYWQLTAFTNEKFDEFCSTDEKMFSMQLWNDPKILKNNDFEPFPLLNCSGHRCSLGKCISPSELCDRKSDCRNNEDEMPEKCSNTTCTAHQFQCKNNQCIDLNSICDGTDDCGDGSDEPPACSNFTCATYLNMTKPWKLCDSHVDCWDKSDENSTTCPFQCNSTSHFKCQKSNECIPIEFICDGERDCREGEDESECQKFDQTEKDTNKPNLLQQSRGKWYNTCWKEDFTEFYPGSFCKPNNSTLKFIPGKEIPINEYTTVVLRNKKEFKLLAKPLIQPNLTDICQNMHLECNQTNVI